MVDRWQYKTAIAVFWLMLLVDFPAPFPLGVAVPKYHKLPFRHEVHRGLLIDESNHCEPHGLLPCDNLHHQHRQLLQPVILSHLLLRAIHHYRVAEVRSPIFAAGYPVEFALAGLLKLTG